MKILKLKLTNCYLIPVNSRYLLVDTGYEWEWDTFQKRLGACQTLLHTKDLLSCNHEKIHWCR